MSDFYDIESLLRPEERALRDRAREWVKSRYLPVVRDHYRAGTFPTELIPEMSTLGAFGGTLKTHGCAGLSSVAYGLLMQELERGDSGLRTMASVQGALCMTAINLFGSDAQKDRWLPLLGRGEKLGCFGLTEPGAGSNPAGMQSRAVARGAGYVLNGDKMWIGNANIADVAVIWAKLDDDIRGFLVNTPRDGFHAELMEGKLSMRAALTCRIEMRNCEGELLPGSGGLKSPLACLNHARFSIAWGTLGAALACYEEARDYALVRQQFDRPIAGFQLTQAKLADMLTEITKAQLLAWRLAVLKDEGRATPAQISMAKRNNVEIALACARTAREMLGAMGILDDYQCFRHMCNLESVKTYEGTQDMHALILGREITGISAFA
ncbi:MAG: acyl-CoA dehydrogenase [Armatimonadetes bacterium]|nr:acyl-CoA dehydrogenase [Armatimonadota bacterium]